jgi:hypothetical protein
MMPDSMTSLHCHGHGNGKYIQMSNEGADQACHDDANEGADQACHDDAFTLIFIMTVFFFLDKKNSSSNFGAKTHRFGLCSQRSVSILFFLMLKKRQSL